MPLTRRAAILCALPTSVSAFVSRKPLFVSNAKVKNTVPVRRSNGMTMYFDDVSREHSINPMIDGSNMMPPLDLSQMEKNAAAEKVNAMKRLLGHDADSAALLTEEDVRRQTMSWAEESGLVGKAFGSEKYEAVLGMDVYTTRTMVGCLAGFWKSAVAFINENADEHYPIDIWKTDNLELSRVFLIAFPNCSSLYEYATISTMSAAVEFCKKSCLHYGRKFSLTLFHPHYKNSPKMMSPMRHSPFPCLGLHVFGEYDSKAERGGYTNADPPKGSTRKNRAHVDDFIPTLSEKKRSLETLFNSAAASSSTDERTAGSRKMNDQQVSGDAAIAMTKRWINKKSGNKKDSKTKRMDEDSSQVLRFADTVGDRWRFTDAEMAEAVYADIWHEISELYDFGIGMEEKNEEHKEAGVLSTMFVATAFSSFNASTFKRFAVTVNAALKEFTAGKMFLEIFHPEYVGNAGYRDSFRRSPFPTIQICYRMGRID